MRVPDLARTIGIDRGPWPETDFPTRRRTNQFGVHHVFSTDALGGSAKTRNTLISSLEKNGEALIVQFNPKTSLDDESGNLRRQTIDFLLGRENTTGVNKIVLDLANVSQCNSSGLGLLITLSKKARADHRIQLYVINPSAVLRESLRTTNLDKMIIPKDSLEEALLA